MEKTLKNFVIDVLKDKLDEYEGTYYYGSDLVYDLLEEYNLNGSYTYNAYESNQWIQEHFDELGNIVKKMIEEGLPPCNVFENPETFQVQIMLFVAADLLSKCDTVSAFWDEKQELTKEIIAKIKEELDNL